MNLLLTSGGLRNGSMLSALKEMLGKPSAKPIEDVADEIVWR